MFVMAALADVPDLCLALPHVTFCQTSPAEVFVLSDCESCRTLAMLSRLHLGRNSTETQASSFLQSVCLLHPRAIPKVLSLPVTLTHSHKLFIKLI